MLDNDQYRIRALKICSALEKWSDNGGKHRPREAIAFIDSIADEMTWPERSESKTIFEPLRSFRKITLDVSAKRIVKRVNRQLQRTSSRRRIEIIQQAIASLANLYRKVGPAESIANSMTHLYDRWVEAVFYGMMDRAHALAQRGNCDRAAQLCSQARAFIQEKPYRDELDRCVHLEELTGVLQFVQKNAARANSKSERCTSSSGGSDPLHSSPWCGERNKPVECLT